MLAHTINSTTSVNYEMLVVDDEPAVLNALKRALRPSGYRIHLATSGKEALDILAAHSIAVVLTDYKMPGMTGADLLKYIHQFYPQTITLMLSGENDFSMAVELLNGGLVNKYLTKPWDNSLLISEIEQAFTFHRNRRQHGRERRIQQLTAQLQQPPLATDNSNNVVDFCTRDSLVVVKLVNIEDITLSYGDEMACTLMNHVENRLRALVKGPCQRLDDDNGLFSFQLSERSAHQLRTECERLRRKLQKTYVIESRAVYCQVGMGIRRLGTQPGQLSQIVKNLELQILQEVNQCKVTHLDEVTIRRYERQQHLRADVGQALDDNQFQLAFQPKVSLTTGRIDGAEVLLRWQHQRFGWVPPSEFLKLTELDGQIEAIGEWVIKRSVRAAAELIRFSSDIQRIAVNISFKQLQNLNIIHVLKESLALYSLAPSRLELEITESAVANNCEFTNALLWQLKLLGVNIAIDDFGAGLTSMSYLSKLPVDVLKLDKSLVDNIDVDSNKCELVKNLISTCHRMKLETVAEGVETQTVLNALKRIGCQKAQGFLFSQAMPRKELEKMIIHQPFVQTCIG